MLAIVSLVWILHIGNPRGDSTAWGTEIAHALTDNKILAEGVAKNSPTHYQATRGMDTGKWQIQPMFFFLLFTDSMSFQCYTQWWTDDWIMIADKLARQARSRKADITTPRRFLSSNALMLHLARCTASSIATTRMGTQTTCKLLIMCVSCL